LAVLVTDIQAVSRIVLQVVSGCTAVGVVVDITMMARVGITALQALAVVLIVNIVETMHVPAWFLSCNTNKENSI
jgi:ABC-type transport system involved in cytochrome bd biosynthesis fused ATPase/permease subunit